MLPFTVTKAQDPLLERFPAPIKLFTERLYPLKAMPFVNVNCPLAVTFPPRVTPAALLRVKVG